MLLYIKCKNPTPPTSINAPITKFIQYCLILALSLGEASINLIPIYVSIIKATPIPIILVASSIIPKIFLVAVFVPSRLESTLPLKTPVISPSPANTIKLDTISIIANAITPIFNNLFFIINLYNSRYYQQIFG